MKRRLPGDALVADQRRRSAQVGTAGIIREVCVTRISGANQGVPEDSGQGCLMKFCTFQIAEEEAASRQFRLEKVDRVRSSIDVDVVVWVGCNIHKPGQECGG